MFRIALSLCFVLLAVFMCSPSSGPHSADTEEVLGVLEPGLDSALFAPGTKVLYLDEPEVNHAYGPVQRVVAVNLTTSKSAAITSTRFKAHGADWSPDGRKILLSGFLQGSDPLSKVLGDGQPRKLYLLDGINCRVTQFADSLTKKYSLFNFSNLSWSRRGPLIVFTELDSLVYGFSADQTECVRMASIPQAEFLLVALLSPFDDRYLAFSAYGNPPSFGWVDMAEDSLRVLARGVPMRLPIGWLRDSLSFFWQDSVVLQTSVRTNATDFAPHTLVGVGLSISEIAPISGHQSIVLATPKEGSAQLYLVDEMTGTYRQLTNSRSHKSNLRLVATN